MTKTGLIPPLHELAPGEFERRKKHLQLEISRETLRGGQKSRFRTRYLAGALVLISLAVAGAYLTVTALVPSGPKRSHFALSQLPSQLRPGFEPLEVSSHHHGFGALIVPTAVSSAAEASSLLPFDAILPASMTPTSLGVLVGKALIAYFDTPDKGAFRLVEEPSPWTLTDLEALARDCSFCTIHRVEYVEGVHVVVLAQPQVGTTGNDLSVYWLRGDGASGSNSVIEWVDGPESATRGFLPGHTFSEQSGLAVAADIISREG